MKPKSENIVTILAGFVILICLSVFFWFLHDSPEKREDYEKAIAYQQKALDRVRKGEPGPRTIVGDALFELYRRTDSLRAMNKVSEPDDGRPLFVWPYEYVLVQPPFLYPGMRITNNFYRSNIGWIRAMADNGFYLVGAGPTVEWVFATHHKEAVRDSILAEMLR